MGFAHVGKLVYITEDGEILINPSYEHTIEDEEVQKLVTSEPYAGVEQGSDTSEEQHPGNAEASEEIQKQNEKYEKMLKVVPRPLKDHMPDFYLKPLVNLFEKEQKGECYLE